MRLNYIWAAGIALIAACSGGDGARDASAPDPANAAAADEAETVNLDLWLEQMEVSSRELYSARDAVVEAIGLRPGDVIADIGAGTGLYSLLFSEAVGREGYVFAEDIEPLFLDLINRRAEDSGAENITAVLGREDSVTLPPASADVVFIADTYHYFEDRESVIRSVYEALKPGGALIIVDYKIEQGAPRADHLSHVRFGQAGVVSEVEFSGFEFEGAVDVPGLDETYFARFRKPAAQ